MIKQRIKDSLKYAFYTVAIIGYLDMCAQAITNGEIKLIQSVLSRIFII